MFQKVEKHQVHAKMGKQPKQIVKMGRKRGGCVRFGRKTRDFEEKVEENVRE